jgi:type II secretory pathway component PulC
MDAFVAGLTRRSDTEFELTAAARDAIFADSTLLMQSARVIPAQVNGVVTGVRLYAIRRSSMLAGLGFQNGDEIQRIDGAEVASPERLLEVYSRIHHATAASVQIVRRGAPIELHYRFVP